MVNKKDLEKIFGPLIREKINESLGQDKGKLKKVTLSEYPQNQETKQLREALVVTPRSFIAKTEKLSKKTKEAHEALYKKYVDAFNKTSADLDGANKFEANGFHSLFRAHKMDECSNLNAIKLHELYFNNISDLASEIGLDSLPYIKLSRDFGSFENWQFDFIACAMSAREGWAVTVYEPYKNVYMNICVDGHANGIPIGAMPIIAIDMWSHAFYKDYDIDKKSYLVAMMREINWDVIEARMILAEKSELDALYMIRPIYNDEPEKMLGRAEQPLPANNVPIENIKDKTMMPNSPASLNPPSTPASPVPAEPMRRL